MAWPVSLLVMICASGLVAVSAAMNYAFLSGFGTTQTEGLIYGAASVFVDVIKAVLPLLIAWGWTHGKKIYAITGAGAFTLFVVLSLTSAVGFAAKTRDATTGARSDTQSRFEELNREITSLEQAQGMAPRKSAQQLSHEIKAAKFNRKWTRSQNCTNATYASSRTFCAKVARLEAAQAHALAYEQQASKLTRLKQERRALRHGGAARMSDPQAELIARLTNFKLDSVKTGLILLIAIVIEAGAAFGFYFSTGHGQLSRNKQGRRHINKSPKKPEKQPPQFNNPVTISAVVKPNLRVLKTSRRGQGPQHKMTTKSAPSRIKITDDGEIIAV